MDRALADAQAVFFDIDNTLYDFEGSIRAALAHVQRQYPDAVGAYAPDELERRYYAANETMTEQEKLALIDKDPALYRAALWTAYLEARGQSVALAHEIATEFARWRLDNLRASAYERALDTVRECGSARVVGVISNGPSVLQRGKLRALGLEDLFEKDLVFISGEFGRKKPDPSIFEAAARAAGVPAEHCVMIGDSLECDVPSRAVGMRAVLFNGKPGVEVSYEAWEHQPHFYFRSYREFRRALGMP